MINLRNQKGVILIASYAVIIILIGLGLAAFSRTSTETRLNFIQDSSLQAFYNAEKGLSYAYLEAADKAWMWFTHEDNNGTIAPLSTPPNSLRTSADTYFIATGPNAGCYAANDGSFILKSFSDPRLNDITVVQAMGISGEAKRVLEYRISRAAIFDFAYWTPYDLHLNNIGGSVNGGRIHSNGNISMGNYARLYALDSISTGKDKGIYYTWGNYYNPAYYDYYADGSYNINGEVPIPNLDRAVVNLGKPPARSWAGTTSAEPYGTQYPWQSEDADGYWRWRSFGPDHALTWPPREWRDEEFFFSGDSQARNNNSVNGLNEYNTWIYPAKKDANGNLIFDSSGNVVKEEPKQIPAELEDAMWDWEKYYYYGNFAGSPQRPLKFTVYDPDTATKRYVEDTRWKIVTNPDNTKNVTMAFTEDLSAADSGYKTYWEMLQNFDYWKALGYSDADALTWSTHINSEVLDGTFADEFSTGQRTIQVNNTNSLKQPAAWNNFLANSDLKDVVLTNENGEDMEAPRFATTYKQQSISAGLYFSKSGGTVKLNYGNGTQTSYSAQNCPDYDTANPSAYETCLENSIDTLVATLNTNSNGDLLTPKPAKKVKFINTYTNKMNVVLELDLEKLGQAGYYPANGIIYSELPVRLTHAQKLPAVNDAAKATFNVISEENIYLKGDYNNPADSESDKWMTSAIISKKQIYTLSNDFNDPQVSPAFINYPNYPYVYVTYDANNNIVEADPNTGGGTWVGYWYFDSVNDPRYNQAVALRNAINTDWRSTFDKVDASGEELYTVSSTHHIINGQTWGAMPNRVQNNHTYNCLLASYYNGYAGYRYEPAESKNVPRGGIPGGVILERWINDSGQTRSKTLKGAYFQLDWAGETDEDRFNARQSDGPLDYYYYAAMDYRPSSRAPSSPIYSDYYLFVQSPWASSGYDSRFRNQSVSKSKAIFFGGGESSWREISSNQF